MTTTQITLFWFKVYLLEKMNKRESSDALLPRKANSILQDILVFGRNVVRINKDTCVKHSEFFEEM